MMDLDDLYQELVLDHARSPRNLRAIADCAQTDCTQIHGANPLCGDKLTLYVKINGDQVEDVAFEGSGCAIFTASSSLMTEAVAGESVKQARRTLGRFISLLTEENPQEVSTGELGKLAALAGVREFPIRVKCATLPWRSLEAALEGMHDTATTE